MLSGLDFGVVVFITSWIHCHVGKPPASQEDSSSSTVPGLVRHPSGSFAPFPLTLDPLPQGDGTARTAQWKAKMFGLFSAPRRVHPLPSEASEGRGIG